MPQPGRGDRPPLYFYLDRFDVGGVERIVLNLLTGLRQRGWATHLVLNQASGTLLPALSASVPLTGLGVRRFASAAPALARGHEQRSIRR